MKLTDFTSAQLDTLSMAIAQRMNDQEDFAKSFERYELHQMDGFNKSYLIAKKEAENCQALLIQVLNAKQIVKRFETVASN